MENLASRSELGLYPLNDTLRPLIFVIGTDWISYKTDNHLYTEAFIYLNTHEALKLYFLHVIYLVYTQTVKLSHCQHSHTRIIAKKVSFARIFQIICWATPYGIVCTSFTSYANSKQIFCSFLSVFVSITLFNRWSIPQLITASTYLFRTTHNADLYITSAIFILSVSSATTVQYYFYLVMQQ